jgi:hypothetical protein
MPRVLWMCDTIAGGFASRPVDIRKSNMPQSGRSESRVVDSEGASMARSYSGISTRIYFIEIDTQGSHSDINRAKKCITSRLNVGSFGLKKRFNFTFKQTYARTFSIQQKRVLNPTCVVHGSSGRFSFFNKLKSPVAFRFVNLPFCLITSCVEQQLCHK